MSGQLRVTFRNGQRTTFPSELSAVEMSELIFKASANDGWVHDGPGWIHAGETTAFVAADVILIEVVA
jgi:hypothetical protein